MWPYLQKPTQYESEHMYLFSGKFQMMQVRTVLGQVSLQNVFMTIDVFNEEFNTCICLRSKQIRIYFLSSENR
jgi:hypothetical protein